MYAACCTLSSSDALCLLGHLSSLSTSLGRPRSLLLIAQLYHNTMPTTFITDVSTLKDRRVHRAFADWVSKADDEIASVICA